MFYIGTNQTKKEEYYIKYELYDHRMCGNNMRVIQLGIQNNEYHFVIDNGTQSSSEYHLVIDNEIGYSAPNFLLPEFIEILKLALSDTRNFENIPLELLEETKFQILTILLNTILGTRMILFNDLYQIIKNETGLDWKRKPQMIWKDENYNDIFVERIIYNHKNDIPFTIKLATNQVYNDKINKNYNRFIIEDLEWIHDLNDGILYCIDDYLDSFSIKSIRDYCHQLENQSYKPLISFFKYLAKRDYVQEHLYKKLI